MAYRMATQAVPAPAPVPVMTEAPETAAVVAETAAPAIVGRSAAVTLRYLGRGAARLIGPVTGRRYDVSPDRPTLALEPRDAAVLLRQGVMGRV